MYSPSSSGPPFRILVVEDEFLIAMDLTATLEAGGYVVAGSVASVSEALAILEGILPHACVLDVNLRGQISAPVAEALRRLAVPFLLSSAYKQQALNEYPAFRDITNISKPADPGELLATLGALLP